MHIEIKLMRQNSTRNSKNLTNSTIVGSAGSACQNWIKSFMNRCSPFSQIWNASAKISRRTYWVLTIRIPPLSSPNPSRRSKRRRRAPKRKRTSNPTWTPCLSLAILFSIMPNLKVLPSRLRELERRLSFNQYHHRRSVRHHLSKKKRWTNWKRTTPNWNLWTKLWSESVTNWRQISTCWTNS